MIYDLRLTIRKKRLATNWPPAPGTYPAWPPAELGTDWLSFSDIQMGTAIAGQTISVDAPMGGITIELQPG